MDMQRNQQSDSGFTKHPGHVFQKLSLWFGILSLLLIFTLTVFPTFLFGGLSILFGILSKGSDSKFALFSKIGIITSILGILGNVTLIVSIVFLIATNQEFQDKLSDSYHEMNKLYEDTYDISLDELYPELDEFFSR